MDVGIQTERMGALKNRRKTRGREEREIYSGVFRRSRAASNTTTLQAITDPRCMVPMAGLSTSLPLPFAGSTCAGTRPFTSPLPESEVIELGAVAMEVKEAKAGVEQSMELPEVGLDDSGVVVGVEEEENDPPVHSRLPTPCIHPGDDDEEGGGGTVGQRGPAPTPHLQAWGCVEPSPQEQEAGEQELEVPVHGLEPQQQHARQRVGREAVGGVEPGGQS